MDYYDIFALIGMCFIVSYAASWLNILSIKLEDSGRSSVFFCNVSAFLGVALYLLSFPVTACRFFVFRIKSERLVKSALKECEEKNLHTDPLLRNELYLKAERRDAYASGESYGFQRGKEIGESVGYGKGYEAGVIDSYSRKVNPRLWSQLELDSFQALSRFASRNKMDPKTYCFHLIVQDLTKAGCSEDDAKQQAQAHIDSHRDIITLSHSLVLDRAQQHDMPLAEYLYRIKEL